MGVDIALEDDALGATPATYIGGTDVADGIRWVGLDVHAHESTTDRAPADRVKTDKRDAVRLARRLAAGELTLVTVPSVEHEQLRGVLRSAARFLERGRT